MLSVSLPYIEIYLPNFGTFLIVSSHFFRGHLFIKPFKFKKYFFHDLIIFLVYLSQILQLCSGISYYMNQWTFTIKTEILNLVEFITII